MKKSKLRIAIVVIIFILVSAIVAVKIVHDNISKQLDLTTETRGSVEIKSGETLFTVLKKLNFKEQDDLSIFYLKIWLKINPENSNIKKGHYSFEEGTRLSTLVDKFKTGDTSKFFITLIEGLTLKQWYGALKNESALIDDLPTLNRLYEHIDVLDFCTNEYSSLEGCFLPDTYQFSYKDSALGILIRAHKDMQTFLDDAWQQRYSDIPIANKYEALTLASIIEKETAVAGERGLIAGVFSNRLEQGMRLQTDPTVIYGIGDAFDGNITRQHLRTHTPYNTYRIDGLPRTPIAMSSRESIIAALRPEITNYLYFVSKNDGTHQFSESLEEHNKAVLMYQINKGK